MNSNKINNFLIMKYRDINEYNNLNTIIKVSNQKIMKILGCFNGIKELKFV